MLRRLEQSLVPRDQFEIAFKALVQDITDDSPLEVVAVNDTNIAAKPAHRSSLSITSDRNAYQRGDTPIFTIFSEKDCFLTLTNVDEKGEGTVLFPNKFQQDNRIRANAEIQFPAADAPFQYRMKDRGFETVIGVCTEQARDVDGIKHDFGRSDFTVVDNYTRSVTRVIAIEAKTAAGTPVSSSQVPQNAKSEISRTAIKVEVR
jgi:Domain of unknown function (DUF4384)